MQDYWKLTDNLGLRKVADRFGTEEQLVFLNANWDMLDNILAEHSTALASVGSSGLSLDGFPIKTPEVDDTARVQRALEFIKTSPVKLLRLPSGTFSISGTLKVPNGASIIGSGRSTILKAVGNLETNRTTSNNTGQFFEVHLVDDVLISGINFEGQNFNAGAVCISGSNNVTVSFCYNQNTPVHGIQVANSGSNLPKNINIICNAFENVLYGAQMWDAEDVLLLGNRVNKAKAGLWHAVSRNVRYLGNYIQNCEDVGIDMEGGENCIASFNVAKDCKNGEYTIFKGNANNKNYAKNLVFSNNLAVHSATYIKRDGTSEATAFGALTLHSINEDATEGVVFKDNQVAVYGAGTGIYSNVLSATGTGACGVSFKNNDFYLKDTSSKAHKLQSAVGVNVEDNRFIYEVANDSTSEFKNCFKGTARNNKYSFRGGRAGTGYAVLLYTDISSATTETFLFSFNKVRNAGEYALKSDAYQNAGKDMFILEDNSLSEVPVNNGGLFQTGNYGAKFVNQRLKMLIAPTGTVDLRTVSALNHSNGNKKANARGELIMETDGAKRNLYSLFLFKHILKSYDGSGASTGVIGDATYYITVTGSTITFPAMTYTNSNTYLNVVLDS
jgi:hypothetical protein